MRGSLRHTGTWHDMLCTSSKDMMGWSRRAFSVELRSIWSSRPCSMVLFLENRTRGMQGRCIGTCILRNGITGRDSSIR